MRLATLALPLAVIACKGGPVDGAAALDCAKADAALGRTLLSPSEPRKNAAWPAELATRMASSLASSCRAQTWTRAEFDCMNREGSCGNAELERTRERARLLAESVAHEFDAKISPRSPDPNDQIGSPLPRGSTDPDYPTPQAAGTDKIFTTEDPDRGPKVPVDFALPAKADLEWKDHAYCEDDKIDIVCSPDPAPKGQIWAWRVGKRGKDLVVAESLRAGRVVETYAYVMGHTGTADHRMQIDTYGRVVDALLFAGDRFSGRKVNGGNALEGCGGMQWKAADGHVAELACLQWGGDPMRDLARTAKSTYVRDKLGFIVEHRRLDLDGKPISQNDGVPTTVFERDAQGRVVVERYRDGSGIAMAAKSGCFAVKIERDASGTMTKRTCLAQNDQPMARAAGFAIETWEHDGKGCHVKSRKFNDGAMRAVDHDSVHGENLVTDDVCAVTTRTCLDTGERTAPCGPAEPARYVTVRDKFGQATSVKHWNAQGSTTFDPVYEAFEIRKEYDGVGNTIALNCHDERGKLMLCGRTGFAGDRSTFDDAGRRTEVRFVDEHGKPGTNVGATVRKIRYDNYDHVFETTQFDEEGKPFVLMGQTLRRDLYDSLHRHFAVLLLDGNGKPASYTGCYQGIACPNVPWHAVRVMRRSDGTPESNIYFNAQGKEFLKIDCRTQRCFDE